LFNLFYICVMAMFKYDLVRDLYLTVWVLKITFMLQGRSGKTIISADTCHVLYDVCHQLP